MNEYEWDKSIAFLGTCSFSILISISWWECAIQSQMFWGHCSQRNPWPVPRHLEIRKVAWQCASPKKLHSANLLQLPGRRNVTEQNGQAALHKAEHLKCCAAIWFNCLIAATLHQTQCDSVVLWQANEGIAKEPANLWAWSKHIPCHCAFASKTLRDKEQRQNTQIQIDRNCKYKFKNTGRSKQGRNCKEMSQVTKVWWRRWDLLRHAGKRAIYVPHDVRRIHTRHRCQMGQWWHPTESSWTSPSPSDVCTNQWRDSPTLGEEVRKWNNSWWSDDYYQCYFPQFPLKQTWKWTKGPCQNEFGLQKPHPFHYVPLLFLLKER